MRRLYEYQCIDCGSVTDHIVEEDSRKEPQLCNHCDGLANYIISAPHFDPRMGTDPVGFPTLGDKWARTHEKAGRDAQKKEQEENGTY